MKTLLNRVLVTLLVLSLLLSSSAQLFGTPALAAEDEVFNDMKIGVMSDLHFWPHETDIDKNIYTMLNQFKADEVDMVMITGDIGTTGVDAEYEKFFTAWNTVFSDPATAPKLFAISGNHEYDGVIFGKEPLEDAQNRFLKYFGYEQMNQHQVINGYHFIGINSEGYAVDGNYTEVTATWLKDQLDQAVADNPNMPIFVACHQTLPNTTYGSAWGSSKTAILYDVLKDYPQVIYFAGHSHYPSENERSIFQDLFTCVDLTSMQYASLEDGGTSYASQGALLVTINGADKQIVIDRYKINHDEAGDSVVKNMEPWILNLPLKQSEFTYTNARAEGRTAPAFAEGSAVTVSDIAPNTAKVNFPAASHDDYVEGYTINIKKGDAIVATKYINGDFYLKPEAQKASWSVLMEGLEPETQYIAEVIAVESFGKESAPISAEFTTLPAADPLNFSDPMDNFDLVLEKSDNWQKENNSELSKTLFSRTSAEDAWLVYKFEGYIRDFTLDVLSVNGFGDPANEIEIYISKDGSDWKQLRLNLTDLVADPAYADPSAAYWMNTTISNTNTIGGTYTYMKIVFKPFAAGINWANALDALKVRCSDQADDAVTQPGTFVHEEDPSLTWTDFIEPGDNFDLIFEKSDFWQKENNPDVKKTLLSRTSNSEDLWITWKVDGYIRNFSLDLLSVNGFGDPANEVEVYVSKDGVEWTKLRLNMTDLVADPSYADPTTAYWMNTTLSNRKAIAGDYSYIRVVFKPFAAGINWAIAIDNLSIQFSNVIDDVVAQPGTFYGEENPSQAWTETVDPMDNFDLLFEKAEFWQKENNPDVKKTLLSRTSNTEDVWITWKVDGYIRNFALDLLSVNGFGDPANEVEVYVSKDGIEWRQLLLVLSELVADPAYADPTTAYWMNTTATNTNPIAEDYSYIRVVFKPFAAGINWAIAIDNLSIQCSPFADDITMLPGTFTVEEDHVCQFETEWSHDETSHWHECSCGAKADEAPCTFSEEWMSDGTSHWHVCECGNRSDLASHTQEDLPAVDPTCSEPGLSKGAKCSICQRMMIQQTELPATGHSYGEWTVSKEATVDAEGEEKRVCSACGHEETRSIPKLEPQPTEPQVTEPQATEPQATEPQPSGPADTSDNSSPGLIIGIIAAVLVVCAVVVFLVIKKRKG